MKILKGILSSILATILFGILVGFIAYLSTRSIVSKKGVKDVFEKLNLSDVLVDSKGNYTDFGKDIKNELVENGIPADIIDDFVDAEELTDFFSDYAGDAVNFIVYDEELELLKADDITKLMNDNIDAIVDNLRERKVEGYEELTDERVQQIKDEIPQLAKGIEEKMPDVNKLVEESDFSDLIKIIRIIFSKSMVAAFAIIIAIFALLIILLNLKNFKWGIWLGVTTIIASLPFILAGCFKGVIEINSGSKAFKDVIYYLNDKFFNTAILFFIGGVVLIVLTIVTRIIKKSLRKNSGEPVKTVQPEIKEEPVQPEINAEPIQPVEPAIVDTPVVNEPETPVIQETKTEETVSEVEGSESFCAECGAKLNAGQNFCYNCGATKK